MNDKTNNKMKLKSFSKIKLSSNFVKLNYVIIFKLNNCL